MASVDLNNIQPVILCGGSGSRLWPLSRAGLPKQFLCLTGSASLFQLTVRRLTGVGTCDIQVEPPLVVTNEEHRFLAMEQMREIEIEAKQLILEPIGRNTAPALTLAALSAVETENDPILVVCPADHVIADVDEFTRTIQTAISQAADGHIVVLGVTPERPETGYGYVRSLKKQKNNTLRVVDSFVEKPDALMAKKYIDSGEYYWNAGIFVLKASVWLEALESFRTDILEASKRSWEARSVDKHFVRPEREQFSEIPADSIDYAVMEHCPDSSNFSITMLPLTAGWTDLGAWPAVWDTFPKDENGNVAVGDVIVSNSLNNLVYSSGRLVAVLGIQNLVIIETPDALLVAEKSQVVDVKKIVRELGQRARDEHLVHRKVYRPWGWYDALDEGSRFKVKRIMVKPKASLSLQKHQHRAEHWVVVKGRAEITCGKNVTLLSENQSTYIPLGEMHRLRNPDSAPLEIIEIQSGNYLGEDDIMRFEDDYGR